MLERNQVVSFESLPGLASRRKTLMRVLLIVCYLLPVPAAAHDLVIWYDEPVSSWHESLSVGNGRLGGIV